MSLVSLFFIITILSISSFNFSNTDDLILQKYKEEISELQLKNKISACVVLVRNSLEAGNDNVKSLIKNSKFDKEDTYNYVTLLMISQCTKTINEDEISQILSPENILNHQSKFNKLIHIKSEINDLKYSEDMIKIQNELKSSANSEANENKHIIEEDELDLLGYKIGQADTYSNILLLIGVFITFSLITFGLFSLYKKQKGREQGKKKRKSKEE